MKIFLKSCISNITGAYFAITFAAALLCGGCGKYEEVAKNLDFLKYEYFTCSVVRVESGESFLCQLPDMNFITIRLNGIDVPETGMNEAKKFSGSILRRGTLVRIEPDGESIDTSGGAPAYVFVPGGKMLNLLLVEEGYAAPVPQEVSDKFRQLFTGSEKIEEIEEIDVIEEKEKAPWLN